LQQACDQCGSFDRDTCDILAERSSAPSSLATVVGVEFFETYSNRIRDWEDFCGRWSFRDSHTTGVYRNENGGGFVRLTNWFEDRLSPFTDISMPLETTPGNEYNVEVRLKVNTYEKEYFRLQFAPTGSQPCVSGMVGIENCPTQNLKHRWGCNPGVSASPEINGRCCLMSSVFSIDFSPVGRLFPFFTEPIFF
jgi:hypothetical protein